MSFYYRVFISLFFMKDVVFRRPLTRTSLLTRYYALVASS